MNSYPDPNVLRGKPNLTDVSGRKLPPSQVPAVEVATRGLVFSEGATALS